VLNAANNNGAALQKMASEFANYHKTPAAKSPAGWAPRAGDIVSGQFTEVRPNFFSHDRESID
jgi:hypothetical protein